jgi:hypothetical protein
MNKGRSIIVMMILALYCACSGGGDKPVGPGGTGTVASIAVGGSTTAVTIGSTIALTAGAFDAHNATVSGQTFVWASSNTLVATVTQSGVVSGVSAGVATITATIGTIVGQNTISVSATTAQLTCASVTPLSLNVGDVHIVSGLERSSLCISGGAGSEYALVAFNTSLDTSGTQKAVGLSSTNTAATVNAPTPQLIPSRPASFSQVTPRDIGFEMRLRERERRDLNPKFAAARAWYASRSKSISPQRGFSALVGVPATPAVGSQISLNGNANSSCTSPQPHGATVVAVSTRAIVAVDTLAPPNGFTTADYQNFAATFDTLIFPLDTLNYGAPTDIDNNGRVLLFFSQLVNALSSNTSNSFVGGFFYSRDLFPLTDSPTLAGCAGSNVGEMFYLPVVDAAQTYNRFFKSKDTVTSQIYTTIVHEFQHLINAGHHLYVNQTATRLEESWLDESQAMLAQELLYYRVSGFAPKQKLTWQTISTGANANGTQNSIVNAYLVQGLGTLNFYLQVPEASTPYNNTENLATLGSGWEFLRYLLDQTPGTQATFTRAIDNGLVSGFANLENVFSLTPASLANTYQSWAIAQYVDGTGISSNAAYSNPSWNFRSVIPNALGLANFPLGIRTLTQNTPIALVMRGGSAAYIRFRVNAGLTGQITPSNGIVASTVVSYALIRTF